MPTEKFPSLHLSFPIAPFRSEDSVLIRGEPPANAVIRQAMRNRRDLLPRWRSVIERELERNLLLSQSFDANDVGSLTS